MEHITLESLVVWFFLFFLILEMRGLYLCFCCAHQEAGLCQLLFPSSQRSRHQPRTASCLELSFVEGRTACSCKKQIPRCEPIWGCHVFPDEIPDLVCCVFLKTHPLPPKTSAGEEKHFSLNYRFGKWCRVMPHFHGLDMPFFPLTAFQRGPEGRAWMVPKPTLRLREAEE